MGYDSVYSRIKAMLSSRKKAARQAKEQPHPARPASVRTPPAGMQPGRRFQPQSELNQPAVNTPFSSIRLFYYCLFAMLFLALYLGYMLMEPFIHTIILACIFAALSHPVYKFLLPRLGNRGYLTSGLTLFLLVLLLGIPFAFFLAQLVPQATSSLGGFADWLKTKELNAIISDRLAPLLDLLSEEFPWLEISLEDLNAKLLEFSGKAGQFFVGIGASFIKTFANFTANFLLMLVIMFFLLKEGEGMLVALKKLTPLREEQEDRIISNLRKTARSVLLGGFLVAGLQGIVGGIGLAFVGIPPLFWGTVMAMAALVPVVGTGLVWIPAVTYLLLTGDYSKGIFLLVWCGILVSAIDSVLRPIIMRGSAKFSLLFLFMTILGGIKVFGPLGIVYGPLIMTFLMVMLSIYSSEYGETLVIGNKYQRPRRLRATRAALPLSARRKAGLKRRRADLD